MGILQPPTPVAGQVGLFPQFKYMVSTDNLATITTAGYLNNVDLAVYPVQQGDVFQILYAFNQVIKVGTYGIFTPSITNGVITLVQWANPGDVLLPVTSGDFAVFNGTTGQIKDAGYLPSNAAKTNVVMASAATVVNNLVMAADTAGTIEDAGIAASNVVVKNAPNTFSGTGSVILPKVNGTETANAVTASGVAGVITTSALTTAGGANYAITWTNTVVTTTSVILLTIAGGTNTTENITLKVVPGSGTATLTIYNNTAATALNGTILISYLVM